MERKGIPFMKSLCKPREEHLFAPRNFRLLACSVPQCVQIQKAGMLPAGRLLLPDPSVLSHSYLRDWRVLSHSYLRA